MEVNLTGTHLDNAGHYSMSPVKSTDILNVQKGMLHRDVLFMFVDTIVCIDR